ncbi:unnamed protein product [Prorocentrum cordatum]|uniref:C3H1-type domain-containing protein n=1 Tax=Prorocentrum cordatum TaxID=2364126 RepID=A0ABN9TKD6_9DINO|nr:unnamed protein product [Polarella glacialis]
MSRGCNVNAQGLSQADGAKLVVKNSFLELTDVGSGLSRTRSDSQIGCSTTGGCPARVDAAQDAHRDAGQSSASVQGGPGRTVSEDSVATGSHCSWAEVSNCSGYKIGGCSGIGDNSDDERGGIPGSASGDLHDAGRGPGRAEDCEAAPHSEAQWRPSGKERQHAAGTCKPCLYFGTKRGCSNGVQCGFCHLPHAIKRRPRPSKAVREQCRKRLEMLCPWPEAFVGFQTTSRAPRARPGRPPGLQSGAKSWGHLGPGTRTVRCSGQKPRLRSSRPVWSERTPGEVAVGTFSFPGADKLRLRAPDLRPRRRSAAKSEPCHRQSTIQAVRWAAGVEGSEFVDHAAESEPCRRLPLT